MSAPKDYVVYIDENNKTQAVIDDYENTSRELREQGYKIIGYVSAGRQADAVEYGDVQLR